MTTKHTPTPSPLLVDDLKAMSMTEVFNLVKDIQNICEQSVKDLKVYSDNMKIIHEFIKENLPV